MRRFNALVVRAGLFAGTCSFAYGLIVAGMRFPLLGWGILGFAAWKLFRGAGGSGWSHGSARMATLADVRGMLADDGVILGRAGLLAPPSRFQSLAGLLSPAIASEVACRQFLAAFFGQGWQSGRMLKIKKFNHIASFAPSGAGKGVSAVIPNLLSYSNSVVVTDVKGELHNITSVHRRKKFGHRIVLLDPLGLRGRAEDSDTFNPLDFIDETAADFLDQCRDLASMLVVRSGNESDPHWCDSAEAVIGAMVAFVSAYERDRSQRNLNTVRMLLCSKHAFTKAIEIMQQVEGFGGVIAREGQKLTWFQDKELGSVLTTVQRFTNFLDSPAIARNTAKSSFDPRMLRTGKVSLYLCLPHDRLTSLAPLQRMWIGTLLRVITKGGADERHQILWLLDEVGHLGHIQALEDAVTLHRGMGIRLWFFWQSIDQIKKCFGDRAPTVLDNIGTQQYFGITSYETAEAVSKRIGDATIAVQSVNKTTSWSQPSSGSGPGGDQGGSHSTSTSTTYNDTTRRLVKPEEIMVMDKEVALVFHENLPPVAAKLVKYYEDKEFRRGGTGKQRKLGLAASVIAASLLTGGVLCAEIAGSLPDPASFRRTANSPENRPAEAVSAGSGEGVANNGLTQYAEPARRLPPRAAKTQHRRRRPGPSGYLIKIE